MNKRTFIVKSSWIFSTSVVIVPKGRLPLSLLFSRHFSVFPIHTVLWSGRKRIKLPFITCLHLLLQVWWERTFSGWKERTPWDSLSQSSPPSNSAVALGLFHEAHQWAFLSPISMAAVRVSVELVMPFKRIIWEDSSFTITLWISLLSHSILTLFIVLPT